MLSRGARLCESIIRTARPRGGGVRECGRPYLARRLGCSVRQVSRYVRELADADRLEVTPPRRVRTPRGWRSVGCNRYRLPRSPHPAPHVLGTQTRRSRRGDTGVTPPPSGGRGTAPGTPDHHPTPPTDHPPGDYRAGARLARTLLAATRGGHHGQP